MYWTAIYPSLVFHLSNGIFVAKVNGQQAKNRTDEENWNDVYAVHSANLLEVPSYG